VKQKEAEKILKYKHLTIEIHRMWNVKTNLMPVITGTTAIISKSFRKYLSNIPGKHEVRKQPYIVHCTHSSESTDLTLEIALYAPWIVTTE
jgi:hypothetical protein